MTELCVRGHEVVTAKPVHLGIHEKTIGGEVRVCHEIFTITRTLKIDKILKLAYYLENFLYEDIKLYIVAKSYSRCARNLDVN